MDRRDSVAGAGRFRVHRIRDGWIDFAAFRRTAHYQLHYRDAGICDRILIGFPVGRRHKSFFLIDRFQKPGAPRRRRFSLREATLAGQAVRGVPELHRRMFLGCGLLAGDKLLSLMEQRILRGLLGCLSEKAVAAATGQKPATLHKYVTTLYAHISESTAVRR